MTGKSVSIRLGTQGKAQVKSDWAEIRQAGESAFQGITDSARQMGAANDAEFSRVSASYSKAVAEMEAADRRRAAAAEKLNVIVPRSTVQASIDASVGTGYGAYVGSARESADVFRELLALEDQQRAKADALRAVLDPLSAAQARYNRDLAETRALRAANLLTDNELIQAEGRLAAQLDNVRRAQSATVEMSGQQKAGLQQLTYQLGDMTTMWSMGAKPQQIFASQISQTTSAIQMLAGEGAGFAAFLANPWVQGVLIATAVLGPLAAALLNTGDEAADATPKTYDFSRSIDVLGLSARNTSDAMKQLASDTKAAIIEQGDFLNQQAANANDAVAKLEARIAGRRKEMAELRGDASTRTLTESLTLDLSDFWKANRLRELQAEDKTDRASLVDARQAQEATNIALSQRHVANGMDAATKATNAYNEALGRLNQERKRSIELEQSDPLARGSLSATAYEKRLTELQKTRDAALKAAQDAKRADEVKSGGSSQASTGDMVALIKQLFPGAQITATTGGTHVKGSDHYAGRAIDFVPGGGMSQYTTAQVEQMLRDAGVSIRRNASGREQLFGPGRSASKAGDHDDHFHVAWTGSASPEAAQRIAERQEREAQRAKEEAIRRQRDFDQAGADLDAQVLQLKRAAMTDTAAIAAFEKQQLQVEGDKYRTNVEAKVQLGDLTRAQADELEAKRRIVDDLKAQGIDRSAQVAKLRAAGDLDSALSGQQSELLHQQESAARTMSQRRQIALQLLDLEKEEARRRYQLTIDLGKLGQATAAQVAAAEAGLKNLDTLYADRTDSAVLQTAGPAEAYANQISQTKEQIYERVQGFAIDELDYFRKGLSDAVTNRLGIKDPLLSQVIDLFIEQVLIKPIMQSLQSATSQSSSGGGGILGTILGSLGSVASGFVGGSTATLSSTAIPGAGSFDFSAFVGDINSWTASGAPMNAVGTENFSGGYTWLAENGPELVSVPRGAKITPASETRRILSGANDNARPIVLQQFDLTGTYTTSELMAQMDERSRSAAAQVTQAGIEQLLDQNRRSYGRLFNPGTN